MYHLRKLKCMLLLMFAVVTANAQLDDGKVYNFVNVGNSGQSMVITSNGMATITATDTQSYDQLWYVSGNAEDGYSLRNLGRGHYLRSSNATSARWTLVKGDDMDDNCKFSCVQAGSGYTLRAKNDENGYGYMHYGANNGGIVCWESGATASQWTMNVVEVSAEDLTANWNKLASIDPDAATVATYQTHLDNLFTDKACTTPKKSLTTEEDIIDDADYQSLPEALQKMVLKVYLDNWAEENYDNNKSGWDADYAKKYRVQLYEPYNDPDAASKALRFNAHTNLNNPTGIFANMQEALYVMVEGEIMDGATLYLASYVGHNQLNGYNDGVELHEGLNIIPSYIDGNNYCINYVVHTFDASKGTGNNAKARKLSDYEDLKIHIEGGYINGYYNKVGDDLYGSGDKNADWDYLEQRATQTDLTVLGEYMVLQFPLKDEDTGGNKGLGSYFNEQVNVEDVIDSWDNVMMWERFVMGLTDRATLVANDKKSPYSDRPYVFEYTGDDTDGYGSDYSDYYNIHGLAIAENSTYMSGGWKSSNYNCNTMDGIIRDLPTNAGSHWGPAHEIGHQHQGPLNMRGLTEVTNNLFSNIVLWYFGETTSRVNGSEGSLSNVLAAYNTEGSDFFTNNIWAMTHMYYKLFLYYHVLGHNTKFYPRLYEMLRQDPMVIEYNQKGAESLLHFYKKCCYASGDDLTEFFRAYGFFRVMTDRFVGDYSNAVYNQTQEEIDAAIAEIKAWAKENNAKENISVLFINDATEGTIKSHKGDNLTIYGETTVCSEMGSYATFKEEAANAENYECTMSGNNVTMSGNGGVGLAIFNEKGEIIAFGDNTTFTVSAQCASAIAQGEAEVKVLNADNTVAEVEISDESAVKYSLLGILLDEAEEWLALTDDTGTKVGYYRDGAFTALQEAYNTASGVYSNEKSDAYSTAYVVLLQALEEVKNNTYDRIDIVPGYTYRLENEKSSGQYMYVKDDNSVWCQALDESDTKQQWVFEATDEEGMYYLKNASTGNYLGELEKGTTISATAAKSDAKGYVAILVGPGIWALQCQTGDKKSLNYNDGKGVLGWSHDGDKGSHWRITAVSVDENTEALFSLQNLVKRTKDLAAEMANVQYSGKLALQTVSESEPYYLSTNACYNTLNNTSDGQGLAGLLDADTETFFHSDYGGKVSETHYLQVDLGSETTMSKFAFNYTTRSNGNNCPTEIVVAGSNSVDGTFTTLKTYTAANDGLPNGNALSWESPVIENSGNYRYLRFSVTGTENSKIYFVMSTFGITNHETVVKTIEEKYSTAGLTEQTLRNLGEKLFEANGLMASDAATSELQAMYSSIEESYYAPLLKIYNDANAARLADLKEELSTLIGNANSLIAQCGTVTFNAAGFDGKVKLQTTDNGADFYLWTNAQSPQEGDIADLIDGSNQTFFHSDYSGANSSDELDHHITVNLGDDNKTSEFSFTYITRHNAETNYPTAIKVYGSVDGTKYEEITSLSGLPTGNTVNYSSGTIKASKFYSYLRFMVTENSSNTDKGGHPFFHMAEFELTIVGHPEGYTVTLGSEAGGANETMMIATYEAVQEAQPVVVYANTESQVQKAIDKLQVQYNALQEAKNAVQYVDFTISSNVAGGGVIYNEGNHTTTLNAPSTLAAGNLTAIALDGYVAKGITVEGTTITVTYNTVYTVQVVGGNGNGRAVCGDTEYADEATFDTDEALMAESVTAKPLTGYEATVTLNEETNTFTVTYRVVLDTTKYYTFNCLSNAAHNTTRFIRDYGSVINGRSAEGSLFLFEAADDVLDGYYIKSYVSDKYINHKDGYVYASEERLTVWTIAIPSHTPDARTFTVGNDLYLNNNGNDDDAADGTCVDLQSNYHNGGPGSGNACSLWTLTEGTPLDKSELLALIEETNNLIGSCYTDGVLNYTNSQYVTEEYLGTIREAVEAAQAKYDSKATTVSEYTAALEALQNTNTTLDEAIANAEVEKAEQYARLQEELSTLVDNIETLMGSCGTVTPVEAVEVREALQLQIDAASSAYYLSTNADQNVVGNATDGAGIAGLLDNDVSTYMHTQWSGTAVSDDHYVQVSLGEGKGLASFAFTYATREVSNANYTSPAPTRIEVYGSADGIALDSLLATFSNEDSENPLPSYTALGEYWTSSRITSSTDYEYLRFVVKGSAGPAGNTHGGHYFFAMSEFALTYIYDYTGLVAEVAPDAGLVTGELLKEVYGKKEEAGALLAATPTREELQAAIDGLTAAYAALETAYNTPDKSELTALIPVVEALVEGCYTDGTFNYDGSPNVTEALVAGVNTAITDAREVRDDDAASKEEYKTTLASLQAAHDNLQTAIAYADGPVQITFDSNSPVVYKIKIARSDSHVLYYDNADAMVAVESAFREGDKAYGWYFMAAAGGKVYIMPYYDSNTTLALSTNNFNEGNSKVKGMPIGADGYTQGWTITNVNMDEANRNAGWYNITCTSNGADTWYFSNHGGVGNKMGFYNNAGDAGSRFKFEEVAFDKSVAYYTLKNYYNSVATGEIVGSDAVGYYPAAQATAYNDAYNAATSLLASTDAVTDGEYTAAYDALRAANDALVINMPVVGKYYTLVSACTADDRAGDFMYADTENNMKYAAAKSAANPEALWTFTAEGYLANLQTGCSVNVGGEKLGGEAKAIEIRSISVDGQVLLIPADSNPLHASGGNIISWGAYTAGSASAWRIVEVEDMSLVNFVVNVGEYGHTSLYLNYPVTIPEGVKAYIIDGTDIDIDDNGVGTLKLTQLTGNVLPAQTAVIVEAPQGEYSFSYNTTDEPTDDVEGNLLKGSTYLTYKQAEADHNYYIFGVGVTEGVDAGVVGLYKNFVEYTEAGVYAEEGTEDATHYRMSANKVLFDWSNPGLQVNSFRFSVDGDATGIDNIGADGNAVIYDLYGRRILEVVSSGIYIINGEKRYVHVK